MRPRRTGRFADGATDVAAARLLTYDAAQMLDRSEQRRRR